MTLAFRPHHFLCTLGFQGKGYSPRFVNNYKAIAGTLKHNEEHPIQVVAQADTICRACPYQGDGDCSQEEKIHLLDQRHAHILKLKIGNVLTWAQAKERLKAHMSLEAFHQACAGCEWKPLGVCEKALRSLRGEDEEKVIS